MTSFKRNRSTSSLHFTKMQGLGNDFMVVNATEQPFQLNAKQIQQLADRHFGVGFDQFLLVETSTTPKADFVYRIFNADGNEVNQCGNGARCIARFVREQGLTEKNQLTVTTRTGLLELKIETNGDVTVDMGIPNLEPTKIPFLADKPASTYVLEIDSNQTIEISACSIGNPHAVIVVDELEHAPVKIIGEQLNKHPRFPEGVNVGFMQIVNRNAIKLRVFERGAGETLACGSGAAAAVVVGRTRELLNDTVTVELPGGSLNISWQSPDSHLFLSGPATTVYEGVINI
jgi:diaminopimelate epimerase